MENVRTLIKQTIRKSYPTPLEVATKYYTLLFTLNDLHMTPRELQLLAFTATRGSISSGGAKNQFIELFKTSKHTIGNLIHTLSEKGFLVKDGKQIRVHPSLRLDFKKDLVINVLMQNNGSEGN